MEENKITIKDFYTDKEINRSSLLSLLITVFLSIPIVLVIIQLFSLFLMRVYLMTTITFLVLYGLVVLSLFFRKWILKSIRKTEYNFSKDILIDSFIFLGIFIGLYLFVVFFIIPRFVI